MRTSSNSGRSGWNPFKRIQQYHQQHSHQSSKINENNSYEGLLKPSQSQDSNKSKNSSARFSVSSDNVIDVPPSSSQEEENNNNINMDFSIPHQSSSIEFATAVDVDLDSPSLEENGHDENKNHHHQKLGFELLNNNNNNDRTLQHRNTNTLIENNIINGSNVGGNNDNDDVLVKATLNPQSFTTKHDDPTTAAEDKENGSAGILNEPKTPLFGEIVIDDIDFDDSIHSCRVENENNNSQNGYNNLSIGYSSSSKRALTPKNLPHVTTTTTTPTSVSSSRGPFRSRLRDALQPKSPHFAPVVPGKTSIKISPPKQSFLKATTARSKKLWSKKVSQRNQQNQHTEMTTHHSSTMKSDERQQTICDHTLEKQQLHQQKQQKNIGRPIQFVRSTTYNQPSNNNLYEDAEPIIHSMSEVVNSIPINTHDLNIQDHPLDNDGILNGGSKEQINADTQPIPSIDMKVSTSTTTSELIMEGSVILEQTNNTLKEIVLHNSQPPRSTSTPKKESVDASEEDNNETHGSSFLKSGFDLESGLDNFDLNNNQYPLATRTRTAGENIQPKKGGNEDNVEESEIVVSKTWGPSIKGHDDQPEPKDEDPRKEKKQGKKMWATKKNTFLTGGLMKRSFSIGRNSFSKTFDSAKNDTADTPLVEWFQDEAKQSEADMLVPFKDPTKEAMCQRGSIVQRARQFMDPTTLNQNENKSPKSNFIIWDGTSTEVEVVAVERDSGIAAGSSGSKFSRPFRFFQKIKKGLPDQTDFMRKRSSGEDDLLGESNLTASWNESFVERSVVTLRSDMAARKLRLTKQGMTDTKSNDQELSRTSEAANISRLRKKPQPGDIVAPQIIISDCSSLSASSSGSECSSSSGSFSESSGTFSASANSNESTIFMDETKMRIDSRSGELAEFGGARSDLSDEDVFSNIDNIPTAHTSSFDEASVMAQSPFDLCSPCHTRAKQQVFASNTKTTEKMTFRDQNKNTPLPLNSMMDQQSLSSVSSNDYSMTSCQDESLDGTMKSSSPKWISRLENALLGKPKGDDDINWPHTIQCHYVGFLGQMKIDINGMD